MRNNPCYTCKHKDAIHSKNPEEYQRGLAWCAGCLAFNHYEKPLAFGPATGSAVDWDKMQKHPFDEDDVSIQSFYIKSPTGFGQPRLCISIMHRPTGLIAECHSERSMCVNREKALQQLSEMVTEHRKAKLVQSESRAEPPLISPVASPDANVEAIRTKLLERSEVGLKKYGVTTERNDLDLAQWLVHLQEELLDGAVYIEAALKQLREKK